MPTPSLPDFNYSFDLRRPFGAGADLISDVPCNWAPAMYGGGSDWGAGAVQWDAWIDHANDVDVRDGITRAAGVGSWTYADGDEVRISAPGSGRLYRYVVVFVMERWPGTLFSHRRAYLLRSAVVW